MESPKELFVIHENGLLNPSAVTRSELNTIIETTKPHNLRCIGVYRHVGNFEILPPRVSVHRAPPEEQ